MLAFDSKISVSPEGALFRATAAGERIKFFASADCLKSLAKLSDTPDPAKMENIFATHRATLESAACKLYEHGRDDTARDSQGRIVISPADLAA